LQRAPQSRAPVVYLEPRLAEKPARSGSRYALPLRRLFRRCAFLNGVLGDLVGHLRKRWEAVRTSLKEARRRGLSQFNVSWSLFTIRDLTHDMRSIGDLRPVGRRSLAGRQLLRALEEIEHLHAGWTVVHGYEAFERFIQDVTAAYIADNPTVVRGSVWKPSRARAVNNAATRRLADCRIFVRKGYYGADDLLPRLRHSLPTLRVIEQTNSRTIDLADWFRLASEVRHSTVHNAMVLSPRQLKKLSGASAQILNQAFPGGAYTHAGYVLRPQRGDAQLALRLFSEHAYVIYRCCCDATGREWQELRSFVPSRQTKSALS
jgi:hypothetical protein